ncbi:MAG: serine aminopeptidase domain-containing protein [Mycoplasma sp.]
MLNNKFLNLKRKSNPENTIIFFHGIFADAHYMPELEEIADKKNYDYISYSMPLHGGNDDFVQSGGPKVKDFLEIIKGLLDLVHTNKLIITSHSAGAIWMTRAFDFAKDRFEVTNLIFVCPASSELKMVNINKLKNLTNIIKFKKDLVNKSFDDFNHAINGIAELSLTEKVLYTKYLIDITDKKLLMLNNMIIEHINVPTLVIVGRNDIVIDPIDSYELFKILNPRIECIFFYKSAHNPHVNEREKFIKTVSNFLTPKI